MSVRDETIEAHVTDAMNVGKCRSCHRQANAMVEVVRGGRRATTFTCRLCLDDGIRWGLMRQATWDDDELDGRELALAGAFTPPDPFSRRV